MGFIGKKNRRPVEEKVIDVDASMQGSMVFKDAVNLKINGTFEGTLDTKGKLTIGENAYVAADIICEDISISGKVVGNITATKRIDINITADVNGDIVSPIVVLAEGAVLNGSCRMGDVSNVTAGESKMAMTLEEVANYLEVDAGLVMEWAKSRKIPAVSRGVSWIFYKKEIDSWVAKERVSG